MLHNQTTVHCKHHCNNMKTQSLSKELAATKWLFHFNGPSVERYRIQGPGSELPPNGPLPVHNHQPRCHLCSNHSCGSLTSCSSFSSFSCSSMKYLEVTRPFWDLSRQSLASSTSWCWIKPSTPSARGRVVSGEHSAMMSSSWPSIWAVALETKKMEILATPVRSSLKMFPHWAS